MTARGLAAGAPDAFNATRLAVASTSDATQFTSVGAWAKFRWSMLALIGTLVARSNLTDWVYWNDDPATLK